MIRVFRGTDRDYTTNGEKIIKPISAIITKNVEEEYLELEAPLEYAEFLIQDNVLLVDTLTGKKGYKIHNPVISDIITVKARMCYQEKVVPHAERGEVIAHGKNIANCKVQENWDNVVTSLTPIGYKDTRLPEGSISIPSPYQRIYARTIEFELSEDLEEDVDRLEEEVDNLEAMVASYENTVTVLTNKIPIFDASVSNLQKEINTQRQRLNELKSKQDPTDVELKEIAAIEALLPLLEEQIKLEQSNKATTEEALEKAKKEFEEAKKNLEATKKALETLIIDDLRAQARTYLNTNQYPQINYELEAHLDGIIEVGDIVRVKHPDMRIDLLTSVIEYKLDCTTLKFVQVQFGTRKQTLKGRFNEVEEKIDKVKTSTEKINNRVHKYASEYRRDDKELVSMFLEEIYGAKNGIYGLLEKNMSVFRQTASEISATVLRTNADLSQEVASLKITADEIRSEVTRVNSDLSKDIASLSVRADEIKAEVTKVNTDLSKSIASLSVRADQISADVTRINTDLSKNIASLSIRADEISAEVTRVNNSLTQSISALSVKADQISATVSSNYSDLNYKISSNTSLINQTAYAIRSEVNSKFGNYSTTTQMNSAISQSASAIRSEVTTAINGVNQSISAVTQTANKISWLIKSGTSSTNFTLTDRVATLISEALNINAYVRFTNLSQVNSATVINGGNITTGTIDASKVSVTNLNASNITTGNLNANRINGGTLDCSKITVSNLKADAIVSGTLDCSKLTVKNLSASSITTGSLNVDRLYAGSYRVMSYSGSELIIGSTLSYNFVSTVSFPATYFRLDGTYAYLYSNRVAVGISGGYVGFFGTTGAQRQSTSRLLSNATLTDVINKVNTILAILSQYNYNLIYLSN